MFSLTLTEIVITIVVIMLVPLAGYIAMTSFSLIIAAKSYLVAGSALMLVSAFLAVGMSDTTAMNYLALGGLLVFMSIFPYFAHCVKHEFHAIQAPLQSKDQQSTSN